MRLLTKTLPNHFNLFLFGDSHLGARASTLSGWGKLVESITSPYDGCSNHFGIDGGDMIEAITIDDPRFSPDKMYEPLPLQQMKMAIKMREPIKDKLMCILQGNHERKLWRFGDITKEVCQELGVEFATYTAKINILNSKGKLMFKIYETHGLRSINSNARDPIQRQANEKIRLKNLLFTQASDCVLMVRHHSHKVIVSEPSQELYLYDDGKKIKQGYTTAVQNAEHIDPNSRWYVLAGSFLRLFVEGLSTYSEVAEYKPTELGYAVAVIRDGKVRRVDPIYLKI